MYTARRISLRSRKSQRNGLGYVAFVLRNTPQKQPSHHGGRFRRLPPSSLDWLCVWLVRLSDTVSDCRRAIEVVQCNVQRTFFQGKEGYSMHFLRQGSFIFCDDCLLIWYSLIPIFIPVLSHIILAIAPCHRFRSQRPSTFPRYLQRSHSSPLALCESSKCSWSHRRLERLQGALGWNPGRR